VDERFRVAGDEEAIHSDSVSSTIRVCAMCTYSRVLKPMWLHERTFMFTPDSILAFRRSLRVALVAGASLAASAGVACSSSSNVGFADGGTSSGGSSGGGAGSSGIIGPGIPGDAGPEPEAGTQDGCRNIDILFVVDGSASMNDEQAALGRSFKGFIEGIKRKLSKVNSYHIGVVTSSEYYEQSANPGKCMRIGSLVTRNKNASPSCQSSNLECGPFASGKAYMDQNEPNLEAKFRCAAQVGVCGDDDERMMKSLLTALKPEMNAPGACNDGFLRKDSLLITVLLTDEEDVPEANCDPLMGNCKTASGGDPESWFDEFTRLRGPKQNNVVISLVSKKSGSSCSNDVATRLMRFTRKFDGNGYIGDICASDYSTFFEEALPTIENACTNLVRIN
jgi:hypothetical protein